MSVYLHFCTKYLINVQRDKNRNGKFTWTSAVFWSCWNRLHFYALLLSSLELKRVWLTHKLLHTRIHSHFIPNYSLNKQFFIQTNRFSFVISSDLGINLLVLENFMNRTQNSEFFLLNFTWVLPHRCAYIFNKFALKRNNFVSNSNTKRTQKIIRQRVVEKKNKWAHFKSKFSY